MNGVKALPKKVHQFCWPDLNLIKDTLFSFAAAFAAGEIFVQLLVSHNFKKLHIRN